MRQRRAFRGQTVVEFFMPIDQDVKPSRSAKDVRIVIARHLAQDIERRRGQGQHQRAAVLRRVLGIVSVPLSSSTSLHCKPPISARRQPVSSNNLTMVANSPNSSSSRAFQSVLISASLSTRSRGRAPASGYVSQ